jgi:hypothetical protein
MRSFSKRIGVDALETRNLLSTAGVSAAGSHALHLDLAHSGLGGAEIQPVNDAGVVGHGREVTPPSRQIVRVHYQPAITASSEDSGATLQPRDPGGVELDQTADSGSLDPRDPGGVEL